jgi:hypothetical protein
LVIVNKSLATLLILALGVLLDLLRDHDLVPLLNFGDLGVGVLLLEFVVDLWVGGGIPLMTVMKALSTLLPVRAEVSR